MQLFKVFVIACLTTFSQNPTTTVYGYGDYKFSSASANANVYYAQSLQSTVTPLEKVFIQGPKNNYLLNSSSLFLPTDFLTVNKPVYDVRTINLNTGIIGGLNSLVPTGVEARAFKDSYDGDYFYQMWHLAHIDEKHQRTNVVTIIVSLGGIEVSPSGDIEDVRRVLDSTSISKVYVQVYRAWSVPVTIPLSQSNIDGWWHSITHAFHTVMHIYNEIKPWIGIARTVIPVLISMSDTQSGLGLKSIKYSPEPMVSSTTNSDTSSTSTSTNTNADFTYAITPGEMSAIVIFVFLAGAVSTLIVQKMYNRKPAFSNAYKLNNNNRIDSNPSATPFV